jgi:hypothetical protein
MKNAAKNTKDLGHDIVTGMIVAYANPETNKEEWCSVRKVTKNTVNLGSVFGRALYYKGVDIGLVRPDADAFYSNWRNSETYMCM